MLFRSMIFALVGNQNCGKTTLFNALTGSNQHVGNFPGVTVDQKVGEVKGAPNCSVVDLPGIYSIRPYSQEEIVTRDFVLSGKPEDFGEKVRRIYQQTGNRTIMMDRGQLILDIHDKERETMSLNDLLELYSSKSNQALDNDRMLLT